MAYTSETIRYYFEMTDGRRVGPFTKSARVMAQRRLKVFHDGAYYHVKTWEDGTYFINAESIVKSR